MKALEDAPASRNDPPRYNRLKTVAFSLCLWTVVLCAFSAVVTKAIWHRPSDTSVQSLLVLAVIAAVLAAFATTLGAYAASHITKVTFGPVAVELSQAVGAARQYLGNEGIPPWITETRTEVSTLEALKSDEHQAPSDNPFPMTKPTGASLYQYERLSHRLYLVFYQVKDPNELDQESRENLRDLLLYVGATALAMGHYSKALDVLLWLKRLPEDLNYDELNLLGSAYLWAADEQIDKSNSRRHLGLAIPLLKEAIEKNPYGVGATYNLGWALLSLDRYEDGIEMMEEVMRLQKYYAPWAKWNIACGFKKLGKEDDALKTLDDIPPGPWWPCIRDDGWFKDPQRPEFTDEFQELCQTKINEYKA